MTTRYLFTFSALDRIAACGATVALAQGDEPSSPWATEGNVRHAFFSAVGKGLARGLDLDEARRVALFDVPAEHVTMCAQIRLAGLPLDPRWFRHEMAVAIHVYTGDVRLLGYDIGRRYEEYGVDPDCEVPGTIDIVGAFDAFVFVGDFKGQHDQSLPSASVSRQLRAGDYAAGKLLDRPRGQVSHYRVKDDGTHWQDGPHALDALDRAAFLAELRHDFDRNKDLRAFVARGGVPDTYAGPHCTWCKAKHVCPEKLAPLVAIGKGVTPREYIGPVTTDTRQIVLQRARDMARGSDWAIKHLKPLAREEPIPTTDAKVWGPHPEVRTELKRSVLLEELAQVDGGADVIRALTPETVTKSALTKALEDRVPDATAALEQLWERVAARDGIVTRTVEECSEYDPEKLAG